MLSSYEVKGFIDKQESTISNLKDFLLWLVCERMSIANDSPEREAMQKVIMQIITTSKEYGSHGETYPSWKRQGVNKDMILLWKYFHKRR